MLDLQTLRAWRQEMFASQQPAIFAERYSLQRSRLQLQEAVISVAIIFSNADNELYFRFDRRFEVQGSEEFRRHSRR